MEQLPRIAAGQRAFFGLCVLPLPSTEASACLRIQQSSLAKEDAHQTTRPSWPLGNDLAPQSAPHGTPPPTRAAAPDGPKPAASRGFRLPTEPLTCSFRWNPLRGGHRIGIEKRPDLRAPLRNRTVDLLLTIDNQPVPVTAAAALNWPSLAHTSYTSYRERSLAEFCPPICPPA